MTDNDNKSQTTRPASPQDQRLMEIRRARNRLFVCFSTLPVYVFTVSQVIEAGNSSNTVMFAYMALYAGFGVNASVKRCPQCHEQYFVKRFFLNPFRSHCAHCGLSLHPQG
jgi:hypothetical protein